MLWDDQEVAAGLFPDTASVYLSTLVPRPVSSFANVIEPDTGILPAVAEAQLGFEIRPCWLIDMLHSQR